MSFHVYVKISQTWHYSYHCWFLQSYKSSKESNLMLQRTLLTLAAAFFMVPAAPAAFGQTVDEIVAKYVQARGGMEALKAAKTVRMTGKISVGPGLEAPAVLEQKRPNHMRIEFTIQGMTAVMAYDGKSGWMIMPFGGKKD